ncbi:AhpC/TSA family protein [Heterostelium album PN500]|uniref:AhpC/TSA family protein n=1 Tax=Heterostelium pallidum (strain ATCC 26659 / Pp 5 / PN500) TaxID=670386 RepID=D3BFU9_HETP5|nr:AhpC/TSA family protein [Heterostelium album PN500]EFA79709.1 AhpC/TSA family protein [Heterostelium album PN500]|eukprot:XP_020431830.1 AhpC/TSA family protein [Heterostelium album PN500]
MTQTYLRLGDVCPDFQQESSQGPISLYEYLGDNYGILFSHPKDKTPICTTELGKVAKLLPEFAKRNVKVLALSVDSVSDHLAWISDINETQQCQVQYPILADADRKVANLYGMIHPNADNVYTVRSVYFIGLDRKLKAVITYPASTGRNFDEVLRVVDSIQLTDKFKVGTPADWKVGGECVIVPSVNDEAAKQLFPNGWNTVRPYLRLVPQPTTPQ